MYPEEAADAGAQAERVREMAAKALGLARAMGLARGLRGTDAGTASQTVLALRGLYRTPWELALQRWIESVAPGDRTFNRPSRRGAERADDVVLPGRRREGWILNVVLDTSGSMTDEIPRALGTLAEFCDAVGVDQVRLVQCDAALTSDELLDPHELAERRIEGYGGSDLSPALRHLAGDQHVRAVVVITDGEIAYPEEPMPYELLWLVPAAARRRVQSAVRPCRLDAASVARRRPGAAMKVIQELVAYFERRGRLTRAADPETARPGAARGGRPAQHGRPVRPGRRDLLLPRHRRRDRIGLGHRHLHRRLALSRPRRSTRASSRPAKPPSSRSPSSSPSRSTRARSATA